MLKQNINQFELEEIKQSDKLSTTNTLAQNSKHKNILESIVTISTEEGITLTEKVSMINSPIKIHVLPLNGDTNVTINASATAVVNDITTLPHVAKCCSPFQSGNENADFLEELQRQQSEKFEKVFKVFILKFFNHKKLSEKIYVLMSDYFA